MKQMKTLVSVFLALVIVLVCCPVAFAGSIGTTYYVDSINGDDVNSGTSEDAAWKTTEKASSVEYSAGDKILFKAGGYFVGTFTAKGSGTAENPIVLGSYGDVEKFGKPALTAIGENAVIEIKDVSCWTVDGLDISAPDGRGVYIICRSTRMNGITVENCSLHDIFTKRSPSQVIYSHASVGIDSEGSGILSNVVLKNNDIRDCGYGIWSDGNSIERTWTVFVSPEESYAQNLLYEGITMNNVFYDGIAIGSVNNLTIRNCVLINTSLYEDFYTAPTWMHHAKNVLIENCEIAGSTNTMDGMAVDFDGWTTDSTYQYIYSHDNVRFMQNCVYDDETQNRNCTVRYCLSVNDNKALNNASQMLGKEATVGMDNFKFYNNTIVNGSAFCFAANINSVIANNIFCNTKLTEVQMSRMSSKKILYNFTGLFTNNCMIGYAIPVNAKKTITQPAGFFGGDVYDVNSYRLTADSPLIGKGTQADEDMGEHDFYGNAITDVHNIGCFDAPGLEGGAKVTVAEKIKNVFLAIGARVFGYVLSVINRC